MGIEKVQQGIMSLAYLCNSGSTSTSSSAVLSQQNMASLRDVRYTLLDLFATRTGGLSQDQAERAEYIVTTCLLGMAPQKRPEALSILESELPSCFAPTIASLKDRFC